MEEQIEKMYVRFDEDGGEMDSAVKKARYMGVSLSFENESHVMLRVDGKEVNLLDLSSDEIVLTFDGVMLLMNAFCCGLEYHDPDFKRDVNSSDVADMNEVVSAFLGIGDE